MKNIFTLFFLFCLALTSFSQGRQSIKFTGSLEKTPTKDLGADFSADQRQGEAPLLVQFSDESTGQPTSWEWHFGDGNSSTEQHPNHLYEEEGLYAVSLTISDGTSTATREKENYIQVNNQPEICDTLNYPLDGQITYYTAFDNQQNYIGYVSGNNGYADLAKAQYINEYGQHTHLKGILADFAIATHENATPEDIRFSVWAPIAPNMGPGNELAWVDLPLSSIKEDVDANRPTYVAFDQELAISGSFFIGFSLPVMEGDTLACYTNTDGDAIANRAWELWSDYQWTTYSDPQSWLLQIDNAIFPVVCTKENAISEQEFISEISLYPNPASNWFAIKSQQFQESPLQVELYNLTGSKVKSKSLYSSQDRFELTDLPTGIYYARIQSGQLTTTRKVSIKR